jgi:hypothetical protein
LPWHEESSTERNFLDQLPPSDTEPGRPISGRVLLDGKPVSFFGVTATNDATFTPGLGTFFRPTPFQTSDGRFTITPRNARDRDLIIAGPGFERVAVRAVPRNQGDIGDVNVTSGHQIEGVVRDESGHPVANATVTFSPSTSAATASRRDDIDQLTDLLLGVVTVNCDERGHYVIQGVAGDTPWPTKYVQGPMQVIARSPDLASVPVTVPQADATADLTLHKAGVLELVAPGRAPHELIVIDVRAVMAPDVSLRFSLYDTHERVRAEIAAGEYDVVISLHGRGDRKERVSITPLGSTKVVAE